MKTANTQQWYGWGSFIIISNELWFYIFFTAANAAAAAATSSSTKFSVIRQQNVYLL
jgi:hypothetical protein